MEPVCRSLTNTSLDALRSGVTRFVAEDEKATYRPSALRLGALLASLAWLPSAATLARTRVPVWRSLTKTSHVPLLSLATRFEEYDENATNLPSALIDGVSKV